jgi:hypothetical protein
MKTLFTIELKIVSTTLSEQKFVLSRFQQESKTTRKAGGLDFPAPMGGETQKHVCALKWLLKNVPLFERLFSRPYGRGNTKARLRFKVVVKKRSAIRTFFLQPLIPAATFL